MPIVNRLFQQQLCCFGLDRKYGRYGRTHWHLLAKPRAKRSSNPVPRVNYYRIFSPKIGSQTTIDTY